MAKKAIMTMDIDATHLWREIVSIVAIIKSFRCDRIIISSRNISSASRYAWLCLSNGFTDGWISECIEYKPKSVLSNSTPLSITLLLSLPNHRSTHLYRMHVRVIYVDEKFVLNWLQVCNSPALLQHKM